MTIESTKMRERKQLQKEIKENRGTEMFFYQNAYHQTGIMETFQHFYETQTLCDVTLVAEGKEIQAHKAVLAACSPYFERMFTSNLKETYENVIELKNITFFSLKTLVTFCYTSCLEVPGNLIFDLLPAADMLQFSVIKESTSAHLSSKVTPSNCIEISVFADVHNCKALKEFSQKFARENFRRVSKTESFCEVDLGQVCQLMSSSSLGITTEKDVFEAMMSWVQYDVEMREKYLPSLLGLVRLKQLCSKELGMLFPITYVCSVSLCEGKTGCFDAAMRSQVSLTSHFYFISQYSSLRVLFNYEQLKGNE